MTSMFSDGVWQGAVAPQFDTETLHRQLQQLPQLLNGDRVERLSKGADYVVKLPLQLADAELWVTVKIFKRQRALKDRYDHRHGSKAARSYHAANYLQTHNVGTPAPIAYLDRWEDKNLLESYYLCEYQPAPCFRDVLSDIYYNQRDNAPLMDVLLALAPTIRAMHDAGFMHGDMGNQNILLPRNADGSYAAPQLIDLNRAQIQATPLNNKQRAFDLSRIILPGAYLKIFKFIYSNHEAIPAELDRFEKKFRRRFEWHTRSRKLRHPMRTLKQRRNPPAARPVYPSLQDIWLWDEKSAQPMTVLERHEKNRFRDLGYVLRSAMHSMLALPAIFKNYNRLLATSYQQPVTLQNRIGVALHPHPDYIEEELRLLNQLGNPPVLIRFCHHETEADWQRGIELIERLHQQGVGVMVAFLQDRRALLEPKSWASFLERVISATADKVEHFEVTHAFNRVKWGVWSDTEYAALMWPAFVLQERFPNIRLTGPACIDFEYHPVIAALKSLPTGKKLQALSQLLYVDRRGAPENKQGKFSTLEKCALLKALAQWSDSCDDKVIVSEVNWPVKYTGIWSPIGCPYEAPKWRETQPGESEDAYAWYMLRYLVISLCSGHVEQVFWWRLSAHGYGLIDDKDGFRVRPAFAALAVFMQLLGKAKFVKKHDTAEQQYVFEFATETHKVMMAWCNGGVADYAAPENPERILDSLGLPVEKLQLSDAPIYLLYPLQ